MEVSNPYLGYKILFEAMVKFSAGISMAKKLEEISLEISLHLKYLLNFQDFNYFFIVGQEVDCFWVNQMGKTRYHTCHLDQLDPIHKQVFESGIPKYNYCEKSDTSTHVWKFFNENNHFSLLSIRSHIDNPFNEKSIPIIKVVNKMLSARIENLKMIQLIHFQNQELESLTTVLQSKNAEIQALNNQQESIIIEKTTRLKDSNKKLKGLIQFNSHQLREPLTRVISLVAIKEDLLVEEYISDILPLLSESVMDLDRAIIEVIERSEFFDKEEK
ncbi:hypothetical protein [Cyclobacterium plantarum]|uniref:Signal transduction histidine kinase dimerisation/phosphoacceptor domain-containing protein n=1 Tax=Cyclobacterium plantarum TaxID=2716263 RepID=A0ABX0HDZ8_9BACT|nr:hypothetical protein [Cyclobacterium plantarum]NHE59138.1 hypothetical protein [Cyclobacterium plantarum]